MTAHRCATCTGVNHWPAHCSATAHTGDSAIRQDIITQATAEALGLERLEQLVVADEEAGDLWKVGRRAIMAGYLCKLRGDDMQELYGWWRRGLDALEKLGASGTAVDAQRETQEALELTTLALLGVANDPQDALRIPRMEYLLAQNNLDRCALPVVCPIVPVARVWLLRTTLCNSSGCRG